MKKLILFIIHCISSILWIISVFFLLLISIIEWNDIDSSDDSIDVWHKIWKD